MNIKSFNLTIKTNIITTLFHEIIYVSTIPFISFYLLELLNKKDTGYILTYTVLIAMLFSFIGGYVGDLYNKKHLIVLSQIFMSISLFVMYIALINSSIIFFVIGYMLFNMGWGFQYPILSSFIMDSITQDEDAIYSLFYWLTNLGAAIGSLLGSVAYLYFRHSLLLIAFLVFFIISLIYFVGFVSINKKPKKKDNTHLKEIVKSYISALKDIKVLRILLGGMFLHFGELTLYSYIAIKLKEQFQTINFGFVSVDGIKMYSLLLFVNTCIIIFLTFIINHFIKKMTKYYILVALIIYILGYTSASYSNNFYILILSMVLATIGELVYAPAYDVTKYKAIPEEKRNIFEAINNLLYYMTESFAKYMIVISIYLTDAMNSTIIFMTMFIGALMIYTSIMGIKKKQ